MVPTGFLSEIVLSDPDDWFGGLSAIAVTADGSGFLTVSDRGTYLRGTFVRDQADLMQQVQVGPITHLTAGGGKKLVGRQADSEGLAIGPDGTIFISFEIDPRVARYPDLDARPERLPDNPAFADLPDNGSLEALTIDANGTLYVVPENPPTPETLPVYRFSGERWQPALSIPRSGGFRPVDAAVRPDGRFYVLERRFHGLRGFSSRLRRFTLRSDQLTGEETLLQTQPGQHDNLEGLSVWRAADGMRATMISDDNFFLLQVTEIVEYHLPD